MINLLSYIGYPFSARYVRQLLHEEANADATTDAPIHVRVESLGGSLLDALQIREDFRLSERPVHVHYTGCSASAATILATGAAHITMSPTALILVHQCMNPVTQYGLMNKEEIAQAIHDLKDSQTDLQTMDRLVSSIYALRAGQGHTPEEMHQAMQAARWLTADEALALGLIDEIADIPAPQRDAPSPASAAPDALSASLHAQFVALGLPPCPQATTAAAQQDPTPATTPAAAQQAPDPAAATPSVLSQIIASLKRAIHPQTTTPTNQSTPNPKPKPQTPTPMTPTPSLLALLSLDALTLTESGTIELTQDQITALEAAIARLEADLQSAKADLHAAQTDLAQADGDTTSDVHPSAQATQDQLPGTDAMNFYNTFNDII